MRRSSSTDTYRPLAGGEKMLLHRDMRERQQMVGAVEVIARAVLEVRSHEREHTVGRERVAHAFEERSHFFG